MKRIKTTFCLCLLALTAAATGSDEDLPGFRRHFVVTTPAGKTLGSGTQIVRIGTTAQSSTHLYRSAIGDEILIEQNTDYEAQKAEIIVRNARGDAWFSLQYKHPLPKGTTEEALKAFREVLLENLSLFELHHYEGVLETNGGRWVLLDKDWMENIPLELVKGVRRAVPFDLLEMIERESEGLFAGEDEFAVVREMLIKFVVYPSSCTPPPTRNTAIHPDCDFDKSFGYPCTEKNLERIKKAIEADEVPEMY